MYRKTVSSVMLVLLVTSMLVLAVKIQPVKADGSIYINADGSITPPTAAIYTADNITYTLIGNIVADTDGIVVERDNIVVDGAGFAVEGAGGYAPEGNYSMGIYLYGRSNVTIRNTTVKNFWHGIVLDSSSNNNIGGNTLTNNGYGGIWLSYSSSYNKVSGNTFTDDGLNVWDSYSNSVENNTVNGRPLVYLEGVADYSVGDAGQVVLVRCERIRVEDLTLSRTSTCVQLWETNNSTIHGNNIGDSWYGILLASSSSNNISANTIRNNGYHRAGALASYIDHGIWLGSSSNNGISGNTITNNGYYGIELHDSSNYNSIGENTITNNGYHGILLASSSSNSISANTITNNNGDGVHLDSSSNNNISGNTIRANSLDGINLDSSSNNTIYHNSFINNTVQAYSSNSPNVWDNGYPSGGNYWSDYNGTDSFSGSYQNETGSDGIGDTPYVIDNNNTDHYPLMKPWGSFSPVLSPTSVSCSPNPVAIGRSVTCMATVSGYNPTGTISWSTSSSTGNFSQPICTLSNGTCSTTYIDSNPGSVTIAACYSGDSHNAPSSGSTSLTVTSGGPVYYSQNYSSVQAAIDAAPPGATVIVAPGFYTESLTLNKPLTIIGEKDLPVFGGGASSIYLTLLSGASGSNVTGIEITNMPVGILIVNATNVRIYGNIMASIGSNGVVLEGNNATHNTIFNNIFQNTPTPINMTTSAGNNTIYGNIITSQTNVSLSIAADGNVVYGNIMSGNQILLNLTDSKDNIFYHNDFLATDPQITVLASGNNTWDDGHPSGGNYWSIAPQFVGSNNTDRYPLTKPWPLATGHCVAVISVVTAKAVIGQGFNCRLTVYAADNGEYNETFSITAYANATGIGTQQVNSLNASCQVVLTFAWNTSGLVYGNYTISAYAQPVANQTDTSGNDFTLGTLKVTIPGDVNGDFKVGLPDLVLLAQAYSSKPSNGNWNPNADIDGNGAVGLSDLVILAQHYGQHYP